MRHPGGGLGTRISEESYLKPKPMIEIGGKPIIWHIMKIWVMQSSPSRVAENPRAGERL
jgi:choline kinase